MTLLIVETTFDPPLTEEHRQAVQDRLEPCLALRGAKWLRSWESADRRRKICLFEAPDAEALRDALRGAAVSFDRVWRADQREPDPGDPTGGRVRKIR